VFLEERFPAKEREGTAIMEDKPVVVDIKIKTGHPVIGSSNQQQGEGLATIQQCSHVRADGLRCGRRAAPGREECEWHDKWNYQLMVHSGMPYPEDAISIQQILSEAVGMVLCRHITPEQARAVASLCREMRQNLPRFEWEMKRYQLVSGQQPGEARAPYLP
jgi:hypothetical protein